MNIKSRNADHVSLIAICDPHNAPLSPPAFKVDYQEHLEGNLDQVFKFGAKNNVDAYLWAGDMFHLREPRSNPHWLVARVAAKLKTATSSHFGIGGNHDYKNGAIETGLFGSPLATIIDAGIFTLLDDNDVVVAGPRSVRLAGGSYLHGSAEHVRDKKKDGADVMVNLGHFWLGQQTGDFYGEQLYGFDYFKDCDSDVLVVGHHHEDHGIEHRYGKYFVAPGSISITGAHGHDLKRKPAAAWIRVYADRIDIQVIRPKCLPASELLDLSKHEEVKQEKKEMEEFMQSLSEVEVASQDPFVILNELAPTAAIKERASQYLEAAEKPK